MDHPQFERVGGWPARTSVPFSRHTDMLLGIPRQAHPLSSSRAKHFAPECIEQLAATSWHCGSLGYCFGEELFFLLLSLFLPFVSVLLPCNSNSVSTRLSSGGLSPHYSSISPHACPHPLAFICLTSLSTHPASRGSHEPPRAVFSCLASPHLTLPHRGRLNKGGASSDEEGQPVAKCRPSLS